MKKVTKKEFKTPEIIVDNEIIREEVKIVTPKIKVEEVKIEESVKIVEIEEVAPLGPKKFKIKPREDHKCFIGGEWYYLKKNKVCSVDANVKSILAEADLLLPL